MKYTNNLFNKGNRLQLVQATIVATLVTLPLKNIFISVSTILFVVLSLFFYYRETKNYKTSFLLPIVYFFLMIVSLFWTQNYESSIFGLQKHSPMLFVPFVFLFLPKIDMSFSKKVIRTYSLGMVIFALFFLLKSCIRYFELKTSTVFFHTELVPYDPGVIYISVFASFAFFYFIQIESKTILEKFSVVILALLIFLLSSKSIITIDFIIIVCYYALFSKIPSGTKTITILAVSLFLFLSLYYVKEVRERFLIEYETAFIDNTLNYELTSKSQNIYNVSINEAWNKKNFQSNNFFPGTAMRVYQARIFGEAIKDNSILFKGFGIEASQDFIRKKAKENNLNPVYAEYNFHNQYLQTYAELGLFGFMILVLMLIINIKNAWKQKDFLHIAFAITMIVLFLSESFFCRQRGIIFFILLYCLFNSMNVKKVNES
jgi:O-antigen ligase